MRLRILAPVLWVSAGIALAQAPPARPQAPPRDVQAQGQPTGTATIKGRIVAAETGKPLRRAHITASASELGRQGRDVSTDADGRYEIKDLPAGRYSLSVTRSGYLPLRYGQRQPFEQGKPLDVANGQVVQNVDFAMPRMGTIAGRVTDELGDPIEGAGVFAMRLEYWNGRRRVVPGSQIERSDDAGQYRLKGLAPGTYWVMAQIRETWTVTENGKTEQLGYAPTYLPGITNVADAQRVAVGIGQQVVVNDFSLVPGRAAKVSGFAMDSRGRPLTGGSVYISQETVGPGGGMFTSAGGGPVAADGSFIISNVQPGEYKIRASTPANREPGALPEIVTQVLTLDGRDVDGLQLITTAGWSMTGRIRTENGPVPATLPRNRVNLVPALVSPDLEPRTSGLNTNSQIRDDWTFAVTNIFGASRMQVMTPTGWAVKAVLQGDRDITDEPLDMRSGEELTGIEVVLTDRVTRVSGQINNEKGAIADGTVLVFASQPGKWYERSRWVRATRPDQQGRYEVIGLPAGQYFAVAVDYVQEGIWNDPEFLASLVDRSQKVILREDGEAVTVPLKLLTLAQ
jgi:hypothetical protein